MATMATVWASGNNRASLVLRPGQEPVIEGLAATPASAAAPPPAAPSAFECLHQQQELLEHLHQRQGPFEWKNPSTEEEEPEDGVRDLEEALESINLVV